MKNPRDKILLMAVIVAGLTGMIPCALAADSGQIASSPPPASNDSGEYQEAFNLFCKASVCDTGKNTYSRAIEALKHVMEKTDRPEVKLRCLLLAAASQVLDGQFEEAVGSGLKAARISNAIMNKTSPMTRLGAITGMIMTKGITNITTVTSVCFTNNPEASGLLPALYKLYEGKQSLELLKQECRQRYEPICNRQIQSLCGKYNLSEEQTGRIKTIAAKEIDDKGVFQKEWLDNVFDEYLMQTLFAEP